MNCKITIVSGLSYEQEVVTEGVIKYTGDGFTLEYLLNGDACTLSKRGNVLYQLRRGETHIEIIFDKTKITECAVYYGEMSGKIPVITQMAEVRQSTENLIIELEYLLGDEKNKLKIYIQSKEKK